eukprot:7249932-Alexandrium_andersonii.AAC.1
MAESSRHPSDDVSSACSEDSQHAAADGGAPANELWSPSHWGSVSQDSGGHLLERPEGSPRASLPAGGRPRMASRAAQRQIPGATLPN